MPTLDTLFPFASDAAQRFLTSRRSVRQFDGRPVAEEVLQKAVRIAQQAPSVCNRQSARVFASNKREKMDEMLQFQNGNRGFGDRLGAVIVIASDMRAFTSLGERNQCWVDGGIFAMSMALALHSLQVEHACSTGAWNQDEIAPCAAALASTTTTRSSR